MTKTLRNTLLSFLCIFLLGFCINVNAAGNVAKIGDTEYASVQAAIDEDDASLQDMIKVKFDKKELSLDTKLINTEKGETTVFLLSTPTKCEMDVELVLRADNQPDVAQLPLSIFQDRQLIKTITLTGMDKEWKKFRIKLAPSFLGNFYLKFYFAQSGLVFDSVKVIKTKEM